MLGNKTVIFLNAPPRAGKDAVGDAICREFHDAKTYKFADMLKNTAHALIGRTDIKPNHYEDCKDCSDSSFPMDIEQGKHYSPREWYIYVAEKVIKPNLGSKFFGEALLNAIRANDEKLVVITDSGFSNEAIPIIEYYGIENCLSVHIQREGKDFLKDSRSYWSVEGLDVVNVSNNIMGHDALDDIAVEIIKRSGVIADQQKLDFRKEG